MSWILAVYGLRIAQRSHSEPVGFFGGCAAALHASLVYEFRKTL